jgi:hypothetical protein
VLIKPGLDYPIYGLRIGGVRYGALGWEGAGNVFHYPIQRFLIRFLPSNMVVRNSERLRLQVGPDVLALWRDAAEGVHANQHWMCMRARGYSPYFAGAGDDHEGGGETTLWFGWGVGLWSSSAWGGEPISAEADLFDDCQMWRYGSGLPLDAVPPVVLTQPAGDVVSLVIHWELPSPGRLLAHAVGAVWRRNSAALGTEHVLQVMARAVNSRPTNDDDRRPTHWGGWVPIVEGVEVDISQLLIGSGALGRGVRTWVALWVGERRVIPVWGGHALLGNYLPELSGGWGGWGWGAESWGF